MYIWQCLCGTNMYYSFWYVYCMYYCSIKCKNSVLLNDFSMCFFSCFSTHGHAWYTVFGEKKRKKEKNDGPCVSTTVMYFICTCNYVMHMLHKLLFDLQWYYIHKHYYIQVFILHFRIFYMLNCHRGACSCTALGVGTYHANL